MVRVRVGVGIEIKVKIVGTGGVLVTVGERKMITAPTAATSEPGKMDFLKKKDCYCPYIGAVWNSCCGRVCGRACVQHCDLEQDYKNGRDE